jgi:uncharacterized protein YgfB (UPF0149 family)
MNDNFSPGFDDIESTLRQVGALSEPAEIHGQLYGLVCVMGDDAGASWVADVLADAEPPDAVKDAAARVLGELADGAIGAVKAGDMSFQLLLPDDQRSLGSRADNLGHWCRGFLHGLGVGSSSIDGKVTVRAGFWGQETIREIVEDLSEISRAGYTGDENEAAAEAAYAELVEYVRVSAQLLYEELCEIRSEPHGAESVTAKS